MALKKPQTQNTAPAFEDVNDTSPPFEEGTTPAPQEAAAAVQATTAVAVTTSTSITTIATDQAKTFQQELAAMKDSTDFSLGTFTTFKASNGVIAETGEGKLSLGRWVDGRMMAYGAFTQVSPGDSGAKAKGFVAWSKDGKTVDTVLGDGTERSFVGKSVQDYLHYLRETEGLTGADAKEYLNVAFLVMGCESGEVDEGEIVNIVLAPSSITAFRAYESQLQLGARAAAMGLKTKADLSGDPFRFRFSCVQASNTKNQRWSKLVIEQIKA